MIEAIGFFAVIGFVIGFQVFLYALFSYLGARHK